MTHTTTDAESADDALLRDAHALRDREEAARVRQLGGILVHDLNNVLFALLGRVQLLERRAGERLDRPAQARGLRHFRPHRREVHAAGRIARGDDAFEDHGTVGHGGHHESWRAD